MKRRLLLFLFCITLLQAAGKDLPAWRGKPGLEISCSLSERETPVKEYGIYIFEDSLLRDSLFAELDLPVYIRFDLNKRYCLRFSKAGFRDRFVLLETKVPAGSEKGRYSYDIEIEMLPSGAATNTLADLPVAFIRYDSLLAAFNYSSGYAGSIGHFPVLLKPAAGAGDNRRDLPAKRNSRKKKIVRHDL